MAAKANYANEAAAGYLRRLLDVVAEEQAVPVLLALGDVEAFAGDHESADRRFRRALELATAARDGLSEAMARRQLGELYERQGDHEGDRVWLEDAVRAGRALGAREELVQALLALGGNVLWHLGAYPEATAMLREALEVAADLGDDRARARALHGLANVALYRGQTAEAERLFQSSLEVRRTVHDELGVANALNNLAIIAANSGRNAEAEDLLRDSLAIMRRLGDVAGTAVTLNNLGYMAAERGDLAEAERLYEQSLASRTSLGDRLGMAVSLNNLGDLARRGAPTALVGLAAVATDPGRALTLCACAAALLESIGAAPDHDVKRTLDEVNAAAAARCVPDAEAAATATLQCLAFGGMVELAL